MKIEDFIYKKNVLSSEFCDDIVNTVGKDDLLWSPHTWYNPDTRKAQSKRDKEDYHELEVTYPDKFHAYISQGIMPILVDLCKDYCDKHNFESGAFVSRIFPIRLNSYKPGSEMRKHYDHIKSLFSEPIQGIPTLTILGALNSDYEGGELILFDDHTINMEKGDVVIFPSNFMYPHRVEKVTKGTRYSFVTWST
jgi:hypothetical protein